MSLCLTCGLCCDGTLFSAALLEPGEADALGGRIRRNDAGNRLLQRCPALGPQADCKCAVYAERPHACRSFKCTVLLAVERGNMTLAEGQAALAEVLDVRDRLARALGAKDGRAAVEQVRDADPASLPDEARDALNQLNRAVVMLQFVTT